MKVGFPRKLWQRNVVALVVVIGAVAVVAATQLQPGWSRYWASVTPAQVVPAGQSASFDGHTWRIASVRHLNRLPTPGSPALPQGTVLHVVSIDHSGQKLSSVCTGVITDGRDRWRAEGLGGYTVTPRDGVSGSCGTSGPLQFSFVLPKDAVPTAVDVVDFDTSITVRLEL
jgi:hypothetical protein